MENIDLSVCPMCNQEWTKIIPYDYSHCWQCKIKAVDEGCYQEITYTYDDTTTYEWHICRSKPDSCPIPEFVVITTIPTETMPFPWQKKKWKKAIADAKNGGTK